MVWSYFFFISLLLSSKVTVVKGKNSITNLLEAYNLIPETCKYYTIIRFYLKYWIPLLLYTFLLTPTYTINLLSPTTNVHKNTQKTFILHGKRFCVISSFVKFFHLKAPKVKNEEDTFCRWKKKFIHYFTFIFIFLIKSGRIDNY